MQCDLFRLRKLHSSTLVSSSWDSVESHELTGSVESHELTLSLYWSQIVLVPRQPALGILYLFVVMNLSESNQMLKFSVC